VVPAASDEGAEVSARPAALRMPATAVEAANNCRRERLPAMSATARQKGELDMREVIGVYKR
jgi:hypothetical protein